MGKKKLDDREFREILEGHLEWVKSDHVRGLAVFGRKPSRGSDRNLDDKLKDAEDYLRNRHGYTSVEKHGEKFRGSGKKDDDLTQLLEKILREYFVIKLPFPSWTEVVQQLRKPEYQSFIADVCEDDECIQWGETGETSFKQIRARLTKIRKKITSEK